MPKKNLVILGIVVFLVLVLFPIWFTGAFGDFDPPDPDPLTGNEKQCVREKEWMTAWHMDLLDTWRNDVVRSGDRGPVMVGDRAWEKSLTRTCLGCHQSYEKFCAKCHDYADVNPNCWNCHVLPEEQ